MKNQKIKIEPVRDGSAYYKISVDGIYLKNVKKIQFAVGVDLEPVVRVDLALGDVEIIGNAEVLVDRTP